MDRFIANTPRWLLLAALVYAPWAYGATRPWAISGLNYLLGASIVTWLFASIAARQWPRVHSVLFVTGALLAGYAWFMVWNAKFEYLHLTAEFVPLDPLLPWAPGSLHRSLSFEAATQWSLLLGAACVFADMFRHGHWRRRVLGTMAFTGVSIAVLGLAQRFSNADGIFWQQENFGPNYFATFRNHTNAGSFLNLIWPLALAAAVRAHLDGVPRWRTIAWSAGAGLAFTALLVNTSRAATLIGVLLLVVTGVWLVVRILCPRWSKVNFAVAAVAGLLVLATVGSLILMAGTDNNLGRWKQFGRQFDDNNSRLLAAQACVTMLPESGVWGFGPGTFQTAFPYFTAEFGNRLKGRWIFAHQDYLQTLTEWGYAGTAGWVVFIGGALIFSWRKLVRRFRRGAVSPAARVLQYMTCIALTGVLIHALGDFPLQIPSIQLYFIALVSFLWSAEHWQHAARQPVVRESSAVETEQLVCAA